MWLRERANGGIPELQKTAPEQRHFEQLKKANVRLARKFEIANDCLDLQKSISILNHLNNGCQYRLIWWR